jgi:hypothetical protein
MYLRLAKLLLLALFLSAGVTASILAPFNEGPDEVAHFQFTRFITKHHRLPTTLAERAEAGYKSDWPPLFHLLVGLTTSPLWRAGGTFDLDAPPFVKVAQNNPRLQLVVGHENIVSWRALTTEDPYQGEILLWYLGRWLTLVCGLAGIATTYILVRSACPGYPWLALSAAALLAFLPAYARVSGVISYEPLLGMLLTFYFILLYRTLQDPAQSWRYLTLGLAIGLAGLTKHTPFPAMPLLFLLILWLGYRQKWGWRLTGWRLLLAGLGLTLTVGSWITYVLIYFNRVSDLGWLNGLLHPFLVSDGSDATSMRLAGLLSGEGPGQGLIWYQDAFPDWLWLLLNWGGGPISWLLLGLGAASLAGFFRQWRVLAEQQKLWILLLIGHMGFLLVLPALRFFLTGQAATGMTQHVVFPIGASVIVLIVQGSRVWLKPVYLAALLMLLAALSLGQTTVAIIRGYIPPWPIQSVPLAQGERILAAFAGISLIDYRYEANEQILTVTLQWRADEQVNEDYSLKLTLLDAAGRAQTRWPGQPLNGRYPTRAWAPGDRVRDLVQLPIAGLPAGDYSVHLRVFNESGVIVPQQPSLLPEITVENEAIALKPVTLAPAPTQTSPQTVSLAGQTIGYTFWPHDQAAADTLPLYLENATLLFTVAGPTQARPESETLRLQLVGPEQQLYDPIDQTGATYSFIVEPSFASGEYRLRFEKWFEERLTAQVESPPLLEVKTEPRQFALTRPVSHPLSANFAGYVALLGYDLPQRRVEPGGQLPVTLHWQALRTIGADLIIFNRLFDQDQKSWGGRDRVAREVYSTMLWAPQEIVSDPFTVQVDPNAPPGIYHLSVGLYLPVGEAAVSLPLQQNGQLTELTHVQIGPIKIGPTPAGLTRAAAQPQTRLNQSFGAASELTLLGYDLFNETNHLKLVLYWRAEQPLEVDYTTFVHIRDAGGQIITQQDQPPLGGAYPTGLWEPGEIIADEIIIMPVEQALAEGEYQIVVGMYDFNTSQRLPLPDGINNEVILAKFAVRS